MKSRFLSVLVFLFITYNSFSQTKLGLKFSPALISNRITNFSDTINFEKPKTNVSFIFGLAVDNAFSDNYSFSTGLFYVKKNAGFSFKNADNSEVIEEYQIDYLQIPITIKLYTNEIQPETSLYFQIGGTIDINVFDAPKDRSYTTISEFQPIDGSAVFGVGIEYKAGLNTILFGGFSYYRGLTNTIKKSEPLDDPLSIKVDMITLDLGIKF
jgi:hypothetical protein